MLIQILMHWKQENVDLHLNEGLKRANLIGGIMRIIGGSSF